MITNIEYSILSYEGCLPSTLYSISMMRSLLFLGFGLHESRPLIFSPSCGHLEIKKQLPHLNDTYADCQRFFGIEHSLSFMNRQSCRCTLRQVQHILPMCVLGMRPCAKLDSFVCRRE